MIICKVPYRISLFGGGFDYLENIQNYKIKTIGGSINKYINVIYADNPEDANFKHKISYAQIEEVSNLKNIKHPLVRYIFNKNEKNRFNLSIKNELAYSSGLGGSSSLCVALILINNNLNNKEIDNFSLFKNSVEIERKKLKEEGGVQDQAFASFNTFAKYIFYKKSLNLEYSYTSEGLNFINSNSYILYIKSDQKLRFIKSEQIRFDEKIYIKQNQLVEEFSKMINKKKFKEKNFNNLFKEALEIKKLFHSKIYSKQVLEIFEILESNNINNYKLCGSGVDGYIYILTSPHKAKKVKHKYKINLQKIQFTGVKNINEV